MTGESTTYTNWGGFQPDDGGIFKPNGSEDYGQITAGQNGTWNDIYESGGDNISRYVVEFDTSCAQPKVEVALTAAKDVACDGTADEAFGDIDLADMASGECAIMRGNVEVTSAMDAKDVLLGTALPAETDFVSGSISFCKGENCDLTTEESKRTDDVGDDADYKPNDHKIAYWFDDMVTGAKGLLQYAIKIK